MKRAFALVELLIVIAISTLASFSVFAQDEFKDDDAIKTFLHENFDGKNYGMVIGLLDEHGGRIFGAGKLDNGTEQTVNGDTIFEIGSITKTFTDLLLLDMRGEAGTKVRLELAAADASRTITVELTRQKILF